MRALMQTIEELARKHRYPRQAYSKRIGGKTIDFIGVLHVPEFSENHSDFFKTAFSLSKGIILEHASYAIAGKKILPEYKGFFDDVLSLAKDAPVPVYDVDSGINAVHNPIIADIYTSLFMPLLATMGVASLIGDVPAADLHWKSSAALFSSMVLPLLNTGSVSTFSSMNNMLRPAGYNFTIDFRDVQSAKGIRKTLEHDPCPDHLTVLYGDGHIKGIDFYLEHPMVCSIKDKMYFPFNCFTQFNAKKFLPASDGWKLNEEF